MAVINTTEAFCSTGSDAAQLEPEGNLAELSGGAGIAGREGVALATIKPAERRECCAAPRFPRRDTDPMSPGDPADLRDWRSWPSRVGERRGRAWLPDVRQGCSGQS